jgi:hypothetical protein
VLLSTSAFLLEAGDGGANATAAPPDPAAPFLPRSGPYPELYRDWAQFVRALANVSAQLAAGDTSVPLLAGDAGFLRARINSSLVQNLCAAPRGPGSLTNKDPWGQAWCDYYKVSTGGEWGAVGVGSTSAANTATVTSRVPRPLPPLPHALAQSVSFDLPEAGLPLWSFARGLLGLYVNAGGGLSVLGAPLPVPGGDVTVDLPVGWPSEVATVTVNGLAVGTVRGVSLTCKVAASQLQCATSNAST